MIRKTKTKTKTKTILIATATAITTLLSASTVFADTPSSNTVQASEFSQTQSGKAHCSFKSHFNSLVKDGTITKAQGVAIQTAITIANQDAAANGDFNCIDNGGSKYVMDGLVKDGTITQAQQVAIQSAITTAKEVNTANDDSTREENVEVTTVPDSSKTGTLTRLSNSLSNVPQTKNL